MFPSPKYMPYVVSKIAHHSNLVSFENQGLLIKLGQSQQCMVVSVLDQSAIIEPKLGLRFEDEQFLNNCIWTIFGTIY